MLQPCGQAEVARAARRHRGGNIGRIRESPPMKYEADRGVSQQGGARGAAGKGIRCHTPSPARGAVRSRPSGPPLCPISCAAGHPSRRRAGGRAKGCSRPAGAASTAASADRPLCETTAAGALGGRRGAPSAHPPLPGRLRAPAGRASGASAAARGTLRGRARPTGGSGQSPQDSLPPSLCLSLSLSLCLCLSVSLSLPPVGRHTPSPLGGAGLPPGGEVGDSLWRRRGTPRLPSPRHRSAKAPVTA